MQKRPGNPDLFRESDSTNKTNYLLDLSFIVFAIAKKTINPIIPTKPNILIIVDNPILPFR